MTDFPSLTRHAVSLHKDGDLSSGVPGNIGGMEVVGERRSRGVIVAHCRATEGRDGCVCVGVIPAKRPRRGRTILIDGSLCRINGHLRCPRSYAYTPGHRVSDARPGATITPRLRRLQWRIARPSLCNSHSVRPVRLTGQDRLHRVGGQRRTPPLEAAYGGVTNIRGLRPRKSDWVKLEVR